MPTLQTPSFRLEQRAFFKYLTARLNGDPFNGHHERIDVHACRPTNHESPAGDQNAEGILPLGRGGRLVK